jgi:acyl-CoA-binding protein
LYGLFKFVTVSHTPNTSKPGIFDFTGRAKWDSWQEVGTRYSTQSDPSGVAQTRYLEIAESLGWKPGATAKSDSLGHDADGERESTGGAVTGMGVFVSTMSAPKDNDLDTIHGLAIAGDAQKLEKMLIAEPPLDLNRKDEYVGAFTVYSPRARN